MKSYKKDMFNIYVISSLSFIIIFVLVCSSTIYTPAMVEENLVSDATYLFMITVMVSTLIISRFLYRRDYLPNIIRNYLLKKNEKSNILYNYQDARLYIHTCDNYMDIIDNFEGYYDYKKEKYKFPNYTQKQVYFVKLGQELRINPIKELGIRYHRDNEIVLYLVHDGVTMMAQGVESGHGNTIELTIPDALSVKNGIDNLKETRRLEYEKFLEAKRLEDLRSNQLKMDKIEFEKEKERKRIESEGLRTDKMLSLGLSQLDIDKIHYFYDRDLINQNKINLQYGFDKSNFEISKIDELYIRDLFLSRNMFLYSFNPTVEQDRYTIESTEVRLLNRLGMVEQTEEYPYLVKVKDIRIESNWVNLTLNNEITIKIPEVKLEWQVKNGHEFEEFVAELLRNNMFNNVEVTSASGDQGVDIVAETSDGVKYGFQTKFYSSSVGNDAVQQIIAGKKYYNLDVGVVVTNNVFTSSAIKLAETDRILLWDREKLDHLMRAV